MLFEGSFALLEHPRTTGCSLPRGGGLLNRLRDSQMLQPCHPEEDAQTSSGHLSFLLQLIHFFPSPSGRFRLNSQKVGNSPFQGLQLCPLHVLKMLFPSFHVSFLLPTTTLTSLDHHLPSLGLLRLSYSFTLEHTSSLKGVRWRGGEPPELSQCVSPG